MDIFLKQIKLEIMIHNVWENMDDFLTQIMLEITIHNVWKYGYFS